MQSREGCPTMNSPEPGTPLPWIVGSPATVVLTRDDDAIIASLDGGHAQYINDRAEREANAIYLVYAANELPKREARIERLETALMLVTDGPASRRALSMKEARVVADDALRAGS